MNRLFLRPIESPSHTDAISVLGVPIMPDELPRTLFWCSIMVRCRFCLRRNHRKAAIPPRMRKSPITPTATPAAAPADSPPESFPSVSPLLLSEVVVGREGNTVTVCSLVPPSCVIVDTIVLGWGVSCAAFVVDVSGDSDIGCRTLAVQLLSAMAATSLHASSFCPRHTKRNG